MAKVDPEALEREAEELAIKHGLKQPPETDTAASRDEPPASQADTGQQQQNATDDEGDRGDHQKSGEQAPEGFVSIERYKNAQAAVTRATQEAAELRRSIDGMKQRIAELERGQQDAKPANAVEADQAIQQALKDYPEIVEPLLAKLQSLETAVQSERDARASERQQSEDEAHFGAIRNAHSDFDQIAGDPEFHGWVSRQSEVWQRIAASGSAKEVIELLDRYKAAVGIAEDETPQRETPIDRARKVAEPSLPRGRKPDQNANKRIWTRREIQLLPLADYEKHRDEIDAAYLEGRVR